MEGRRQAYRPFFARPDALWGEFFAGGFTKARHSRTVNLTFAALMTGIAILLSYIEIPLAFFAPWLKLDFSLTPLLLLGLSVGPALLVVSVLVTNLVHILGGTTGGVGELANVIVGLSFLLPPTLMYRANRTRKAAVTGMAAGSLLMVVAGVLANRCILLPVFFGAGFEGALQGMGMTLDGYLWGAIAPFNLVKGVANAALAYLLYKRLSILLGRADHGFAAHGAVRG
ncbi:MAG TPA: ECF transporter S component [Candidatus Limnocylindria bacterium]|nr:ECF transporter S component [Candidatus Limnocylindria bacterium]